MSDAPRDVTGLVGVYDADGSIRGELAYFVGARLGRAHCSLCDVTHGLLRERAEWRACRDGLPVPFDTYHRDDQPLAVRTALDGQAPAVVALVGEAVVPLLDGPMIEACQADGERLVAAIEAEVARQGLGWS